MDVARHRYVEGAVMIIPFEAYPAIYVPIPIFGELIFCFDRLDEVIYVLLTRVFNPKIVHNEGKCDGPCGMFPEAGGLFAFIITVGGEAFFRSLFASIPAWGRPQTARRISRYMCPLCILFARSYCLAIHGGERAKGMCMYSY